LLQKPWCAKCRFSCFPRLCNRHRHSTFTHPWNTMWDRVKSIRSGARFPSPRPPALVGAIAADISFRFSTADAYCVASMINFGNLISQQKVIQRKLDPHSEGNARPLFWITPVKMLAWHNNRLTGDVIANGIGVRMWLTSYSPFSGLSRAKGQPAVLMTLAFKLWRR